MILHGVGSYIVFEVLVVGGAVALSLWYAQGRRRARPMEMPPEFEPTEERFVDPVTGVTQVVWVNPRTGQRLYQPVGRPRQAEDKAPREHPARLQRRRTRRRRRR